VEGASILFMPLGFDIFSAVILQIICCFLTFSFLVVGKHIILYLERVSPGFACFGNNEFSQI
jgi:hypothetical protein